MHQKSIKRSTGFTLIELLVVVSIIGLLIGILLPALSRAKKNAQQIKDAAQLRETHRGLVNFGTTNRDRFPVPSNIDRFGYTEPPAIQNTDGSEGDVDGAQEKKDRTGAIFAILIYQGLTNAELAVNPAEADGRIRPDTDTQFGRVRQAPDPVRAAWDSAFVGTLSTRDQFEPNIGEGNVQPDIRNPGEGSNCSYAHNPLYGPRFSLWANNYTADDPLIADRGPVYNVNNPGPQTVYELEGQPGDPSALQGYNSLTLLIHGDKRTWEGNVAYNDGHVKFERDATPENVRMAFVEDGSTVQYIPDNIFVDEEHEGSGTGTTGTRGNIYMRQWPVGIPRAEDEPEIEDIATWDGKIGDWGDSQ